MIEQRFCKAKVAGLIPVIGSNLNKHMNKETHQVATIFFNGRGFDVSSDGNIHALSYKNNYGQNVKKCLLKHTINCKNSYSSIRICVNGICKAMYVHRIVVMAFTKDFNERLDVDHIDGNKQNNNLCNLRQCNRSENLKGFRLKSIGTGSVYRGVSFDKQTQKWRAKVRSNTKYHCAGRHKTEKEAAAAYNNLAQKLGFSEQALNEVN